MIVNNVYGDNDKYIKTKIKIYEDNVNTNFHGKKIPKGNSSCKSLLLIILDSIIRVNKKYLSSNTTGRIQIWNTK